MLSKIEKLLSSYYEVKEDSRQMSNAPDTTAICEGESTYAPNIQHISGMNKGKADSIEQKGREWKRLKVDTAVGDKAENVAVVLTQIGKERFLNAAGADLMESVSHEERDSCVKNTLGNTVHNETLTTSASEMARNGWTVTKNMYTSGNQNPDCRFASRETDIGPNAGRSNTNVPETSLNEQSEKDGHDSHVHCNELMLGSSTEHEFGHEPTSAAVDFGLRNGEHEVEIQGMDQTRSNRTNTGMLNESGSVTNVMKKTHTSIANSTETSAQSVLKDVTQGDDLNFFFSSDFDEEIDCSSNNSNMISVPSDRSSVAQNTGKADSEKQPCLTSDLVSDVTNTAAIPLPGLGDNVSEYGDFAMVWSKGQLKGSNGKVIQVKSCLLIYFISLFFDVY